MSDHLAQVSKYYEAHTFDGHGGHSPNCPGCEIERLQRETAAATAFLNVEGFNRDGLLAIGNRLNELEREIAALNAELKPLRELREMVQEEWKVQEQDDGPDRFYYVLKKDFKAWAEKAREAEAASASAPKGGGSSDGT